MSDAGKKLCERSGGSDTFAASPLPKIEEWLKELGLEKYASKFAEEDVTWETLREMEERHLEALGLKLGHRMKILADLKTRLPNAKLVPPTAPTTPHGTSSMPFSLKTRVF
jgi:hypothetical protein